MKIGDQVFQAVLDTGATLSIVARRPLKTFKKTKTVAIRVGDGGTIHSLGGVDVTICLGDETVTQHCRVLDTDAFDIVIGTDFLRRNPQVKMLSLERPYSLHCDFGSGLFCVPFVTAVAHQSQTPDPTTSADLIYTYNSFHAIFFAFTSRQYDDLIEARRL